MDQTNTIHLVDTGLIPAVFKV